MEPRNVAWARRILSGIVNFNSSQTDQDFNATNDEFYQLDDALTEAYFLEVNEATARSSEAFKRTMTLSWDEDDETKTLPSYIAPEDILEIYDVTSTDTGNMVTVGTRRSGASLYWEEYGVLRWGNDGPPSDKTLELTYIASARQLKSPLQEFDLIPYRYKDLLPWSAAVVLADKAEQRTPARWLEKLNEWRSAWYTSITRGRPAHQNVPRMRNHHRRR